MRRSEDCQGSGATRAVSLVSGPWRNSQHYDLVDLGSVVILKDEPVVILIVHFILNPSLTSVSTLEWILIYVVNF